MKAMVSMPPKFFAVFSKRAKILRLSFSHPISRSTTLRDRYVSRSNSTGRASRSSFAFDGMTGVTPNSIRYTSIQSARYPLSQLIATGHAIGSPAPSRNWASAPSSTTSKTVDSCDWPGVRWKCNGCPTPSHRIWIFVEKPPRERPNAWSSGSSASPFFRRPPHSGPLER